LILVMRNGEVIQRGAHAELAERHYGLYARLFALQTRRNSAELTSAHST